MKSSKSYGVTIEQLRIDIVNAVRSYFKGRDWYNDGIMREKIVRSVDDSKFRRTDGRDGWMYVFVYEDGAVYADYNVLDHFKVNDNLVFRWDVCGDDRYMVMRFDYSKDVRRYE